MDSAAAPRLGLGEKIANPLATEPLPPPMSARELMQKVQLSRKGRFFSFMLVYLKALWMGESGPVLRSLGVYAVTLCIYVCSEHCYRCGR